MDQKRAAAQAAKLEDDIVNQTWDELQKHRQQTESAAQRSGPVPVREATEQSIDDLAAELRRHPFFATSAEDVQAAEDTPEMEALRALTYEGSRAEVAENFREQGNEAAKQKDWANAKEFYNKSLSALKEARRPDELEDLQKEGPGWEEREAAKERDLREKCLTNRALCHLNLQNHRSCSLDCVAALEIGPRNVKAHYRLTQSLLALGKLDEATRACEAGLVVEPHNASLLQNKAAVAKARVVRDEQEGKRRTRDERSALQERVLQAALAARDIKVRTSPNPPDLEDARPTLVPNPLDPKSSLVLPVLVLYPLHAQTDFIKQFGEEQVLSDHLDYLLPLPWDVEHEYSVGKKDKTDVYLETGQGGLVKWGKKVELLRLITTGKVDIVDNVITANVVPKARTEEWILDFKKRRGKA